MQREYLNALEHVDRDGELDDAERVLAELLSEVALVERELTDLVAGGMPTSSPVDPACLHGIEDVE